MALCIVCIPMRIRSKKKMQYETFAQQAGTFVHSSVCLAVIHLLAI
ncbi:hypothetical protein A343_2312 [Porphyromonas gingivalis JCVI SC001]|nr:hypothetical protein A343_2312 [Porphyromonas gingivalis JCVI SC001]